MYGHFHPNSVIAKVQVVYGAMDSDQLDGHAPSYYAIRKLGQWTDQLSVLLRQRLLVISEVYALATFLPCGLPSPLPVNRPSGNSPSVSSTFALLPVPATTRVYGVHQGEPIHGHTRLSPLINGEQGVIPAWLLLSLPPLTGRFISIPTFLKVCI